MASAEYDEDRENRIDMEIVVDAYNEEEQAMGWYYYLERQLDFPFKAKWLTGGKSQMSEEVEVLRMAAEDDCQQDMLVEILYQEDDTKDEFSVPLYDIEAIDADEDTQQAIADWHYWIDRGYEFAPESMAEEW